MKYTNSAFSFLIAVAVIALAPSAALAFEAASTGSTIGGTVSTQSTGSTVGGSVSTQSTGSTVGTTNTLGTVSTGSTVGGAITAPGTVSTGSTVGTITAPGTVSTGSTVGTITPPGTVSTGSTVGSPSTDNGNGNNNNGGTPATDNNQPRGSSTGSSGGSYGGGGSLPTLTNIAQCQTLGSYIQTGKANVYADVIKLQQFLNANEGAKLYITGVYDAATIAAVNAFQVKYAPDVLAPWGVSTPTSQVYYTTSKKIDEISCKKTFALTPEQIAEITAYRTHPRTQGTSLSGTVVSPEVTPGLENGTPVNGSLEKPSDVQSTTTVLDTQVGAAAKSSVWSKIWNFIKRIFGR